MNPEGLKTLAQWVFARPKRDMSKNGLGNLGFERFSMSELGDGDCPHRSSLTTINFL